MATFLITGAAGVIGSHSAERLPARDQRVLILDDLSSGDAGNLAHLQSNPKLTSASRSVMRETAGRRFASISRQAHLGRAPRPANATIWPLS